MASKPPDPQRERFETRDLSFRAIAGFGLALLIFLVAISVVLLGLFTYLGTHEAKSDTLPSMVTPESLPPEPQVGVESPQNLQALHAEEDKLLTTYGWIDQGKGIVRIPIDRAMQLIATQGLPLYWRDGQPVYRENP